VIVSTTLTPYDTGKRAEPGVLSVQPLGGMEPIERELEEDRYGRVDFDDDASETVAQIWIERDEHGRQVVHIMQFADDLAVMVHHD